MFWFAFLFTEFVLAYEWVTETLLYILPHFLCGEWCLQFPVWHPLECKRYARRQIDVKKEGIWKRGNGINPSWWGFSYSQYLEFAWRGRVETPTLATHNFQPFVNELPKRSPYTTVPTTTNPSITIILDFISPKSLQPCHTLCPFRWLVCCWVSPSHKIPTDKSH